MKWTDEERELAREMFAGGYSDREIGEAIGRQAKAVSAWRKANGLEITAEIRTVKRMRRWGKKLAGEDRTSDVRGRQLCGSCWKASGGGDCEWANSVCRETVPGWIAREITPPAGSKGPWYHITACPKYEPDEKRPANWPGL